jgi:hypothetical protein
MLPRALFRPAFSTPMDGRDDGPAKSMSRSHMRSAPKAHAPAELAIRPAQIP